MRKNKAVHSIIVAVLLVAFPFTQAKSNNLASPEPCPNCQIQIMQGSKWNYVLGKIPDFSIIADVYNIDGFDINAETVAKIHAQNGKAICYLNAGTWENWRPDSNNFPDMIKGKANGWPGEKWLDIRQVSLLLPIMQARVDMCKNKGFDAIEFDNVDGYKNKTGFPLSSADQANYNSLLANMAHKSGLAVGLKNDLDQIEQLLPYFDFAINEQCFQYKECDTLVPFINANKTVLQVEYKLKPSQFCTQAKARYFSSIKKNKKLDEAVTFCN